MAILRNPYAGPRRLVPFLLYCDTLSAIKCDLAHGTAITTACTTVATKDPGGIFGWVREKFGKTMRRGG